MKIIFFLSALLISSNILSAQTIESYKINYKFFISEELKKIDPDKETDETKKQLAMTALFAMVLSDDDKPIAEAWINKNYIRVSNDLLSQSYQLTDKNSNQSFIVYPEYKQYKSEDIVSNFSISSTDESSNHIQLIQDSTKTIAGYTCKLAILKFDSDSLAYNSDNFSLPTIKVWYTEQLPSLYWGEYNYLYHIPGAMLAVNTMDLGIEASSVTKEQKDSSFFQLPDDFEQVGVDDDSAYVYSDYYINDNRHIFLDSISELYGIKDNDGQIIAEPIFSDIHTFSENIAVATDFAYNYGVIDSDGKIIIPFKYEQLLYDELNQIFLYRENEKYGFLKKDGSIYMKAKYDELGYIQDGLIIYAENGKYGILDDKENIIIQPVHENIIEVSQGTNFITLDESSNYLFYDLKTGKKIGKDYEYISYAQQDDLFIARKNDKYGYINSKGETIIPFKYYYASTFYGGLAPVSVHEDSDIIYINNKGENVTKEIDMH